MHNPTVAVRIPPRLNQQVRLVARLRGRGLADELRAAIGAHVDASVAELATNHEGLAAAVETQPLMESVRSERRV